MNSHIEEAKKIISSNIYMTIASASTSGRPWISPVFFAYDSAYNLYWTSFKEAEHSKLIQKNPYVAIVIFDSTALEGQGDGVYIEASAKSLERENEIKEAMWVLNERIREEKFRISDIASVSGEGVWRIYKAQPNQISKLLPEGEIVAGQYIDKRVDIDLTGK